MVLPGQHYHLGNLWGRGVVYDINIPTYHMAIEMPIAGLAKYVSLFYPLLDIVFFLWLFEQKLRPF